MPHPGKSGLREPYLQDARKYVELAITRNGSIPRPVDYRYVWGDALTQLDRIKLDLRIVNLETSVTVSDSFWTEKEIHYRMHSGEHILPAGSLRPQMVLQDGRKELLIPQAINISEHVGEKVHELPFLPERGLLLDVSMDDCRADKHGT
ncbi:MAG: CapA family protein [Actinomycetota bacterium]